MSALPPASSSSPMRLIVAHAGPAGAACRQALPGLRLPHLARLLQRLSATPGDTTPDLDAGLHTLSLPHERALARALRLSATDGHIPWAAWERLQAGDPQAIAMRPPQALQLADDESRTLLAAMQPYFREDGLDVTWESALRWRVRGDMLQDLPCASLDRVVGRPVDAWLPRTPQARPVRRLQQEMQMLLYTHPVNEARERDGLLPVNSFWVSGAGTLPEGAAQGLPAHLQVDERLREPALAGQYAAWAERWQEIDAQVLPAWLGALDQGRPVALTLCGARSARTWTSSSPSWWRRAASMLRAPSADAALSPL